MFERLPESNRKRPKNAKQNAVSLVVHAALIYGAIEATKGAAEQLDNRLKDTTMVFVEAPKATPPPPPPPQQMIVAANPPPQGFQTIVPPTEIPTEIPPVDLNQRFDPKDFTGKGVEGGISTGVVGGTGAVPSVNGDVFLSQDIDDPPSPVAGYAPPRYPPAMESAGIPGRVEVQFVVDTLGHVEPNSFKVTRTTHQAFVEPARESILKMLYKPGKSRGKPVRVLVQTAVVFKSAGS